MAEPARTTLTFVEIFNDIELYLCHRHEHHLCDSLAGLNLVTLRTTIPARDEYLSLVVGIDKARPPETNLEKFQADELTIVARFQGDINRFKTLRGIE